MKDNIKTGFTAEPLTNSIEGKENKSRLKLLTDKVNGLVSKVTKLTVGLAECKRAVSRLTQGLTSVKDKLSKMEDRKPLLDLVTLWTLVCEDLGCTNLSTVVRNDQDFISSCKDWAHVVLVGGDNDGHWVRQLPWFVAKDLECTSRANVYKALMYLTRSGSTNTDRIVGEAVKGFLGNNRSCRNYMFSVIDDLIKQSDDELDEVIHRLLNLDYGPKELGMECRQQDLHRWSLSTLQRAFKYHEEDYLCIRNPLYIVDDKKHKKFLWLPHGVKIRKDSPILRNLYDKYSVEKNDPITLMGRLGDVWEKKFERFKSLLMEGSPIEPKNFDSCMDLAQPSKLISSLTDRDIMRLPRSLATLATELREYYQDFIKAYSVLDSMSLEGYEDFIEVIPDNITEIWLKVFCDTLNERLGSAKSNGSSSVWGTHTQALLRLRNTVSAYSTGLGRSFRSELDRFRLTENGLGGGRTCSLNPGKTIYERGLTTHEKRYDYLVDSAKEGLWDSIGWLKKKFATCRLLTVPKTSDKRRTITPMSLVQKLADTPVAEALRNALEEMFPAGCCFHDQTVQWDRVSCGWATLDASSASDLITPFHVVACFEEIYHSLLSTRPRYVMVEDECVTLFMNSPMGAPQTFPIESGAFLINMLPFGATAYGDDVTVNNKSGITMDEALKRYSELGWKLNTDKSFVGSESAEACGCYKIGNVLFTILCTPRGTDEMLSEDNLRHWTAHEHNLIHFGYYRAASYLRRKLLKCNITESSAHTQYEVWPVDEDSTTYVTRNGRILQTRIRKQNVKDVPTDKLEKAEKICDFMRRSADSSYEAEYIFYNSEFRDLYPDLIEKISKQDDLDKIDRSTVEGPGFQGGGIDRRALFATCSVMLENVELEEVYDLYSGDYTILNGDTKVITK